MVMAAQVSGISFNKNSHRYEGDIDMHMGDGTARRVRIGVVGHVGWPFERVQRELVFAARLHGVH